MALKTVICVAMLSSLFITMGARPTTLLENERSVRQPTGRRLQNWVASNGHPARALHSDFPFFFKKESSPPPDTVVVKKESPPPKAKKIVKKVVAPSPPPPSKIIVKKVVAPSPPPPSKKVVLVKKG